MKGNPSQFTYLSNEALLRKLIGARQTRQVYRGSLQAVFNESGDTRVGNEKCAVARELVKRWLEESLETGCVLSSPAAVRDYLRLHFAGREYESFVVLFLNAQNQVIACEELFRGTLTQTSVYPREIVKRALHHNAGAVVLAHNHPSGVAEPSRSDETLTATLKRALALIDVGVLDHFVVGAASVMSFAERGLL